MYLGSIRSDQQLPLTATLNDGMFHADCRMGYGCHRGFGLRLGIPTRHSAPPIHQPPNVRICQHRHSRIGSHQRVFQSSICIYDIAEASAAGVHVSQRDADECGSCQTRAMHRGWHILGADLLSFSPISEVHKMNWCTYSNLGRSVQVRLIIFDIAITILTSCCAQ